MWRGSIPAAWRRALSFEQAEEIRRRYAAAGGRRGVLVPLGRQYGLSPTPLAKIIAGRTYRVPEDDPRAPHTTRRPLTEAQWAAIVHGFAAGEPHHTLAYTYGVSPQTIHRVLKAA